MLLAGGGFYSGVRFAFQRNPSQGGGVRADDWGMEDVIKPLRSLLSLPYLSGYKTAPERSGVVAYDRDKAGDGVNLYVSGHAPEALLVDMSGELLHRWACAYEHAWPDGSLYLGDENEQPLFWRRAHLFPNGDLLAIFDYIGLIKLDSDSNLLWRFKGGCHHDLNVTEDGTIYVISYKKRLIPEINENVPVIEDYVTILSPEGELMSEFSLVDLILNSPYANFIQFTNDLPTDIPIDIIHTNTIEVFDGRRAAYSPLFARGNIMLSFLYLNSIAIIDPDLSEVLWFWGPNNTRLQHQPMLLPNGNLLIFTNYLADCFQRDASAVIEFNPSTRFKIWEYRGSPEHPFFAESCGSNQRLENGNTLITESTTGRAFEVTPEKEIVWEFINPHRTGEDGELIPTLFELIRIDPAALGGWLDPPPGKS